MDERTSILVCLGAAVAANCVACFRHYHGEAQRIGLQASEIEAAVALGAKVKTGANIAVMSVVGKTMRGVDPQAGTVACGPDTTPCCCSTSG